MNENALLIQPVSMPSLTLEQAVQRYTALTQFYSQILRDGTDYGTIPGTTKPTLLKPGAEKLTMFFGLRPTFELVQAIEDWSGREHDGEPFFYYWFRCRLTKNNEVVAEADGSCNSHESKYRYRKAERKCPACELENIRKSKDSGWYCWKKTGGCGATYRDGDAAIEKQEVGRVLNQDIADQVNTLQKVAQKRALVAATLIGVNASEFFTQDLEDLPGYGEVIDVTPTVSPTTTAPARPEPPAKSRYAAADELRQQARQAAPKPPAHSYPHAVAAGLDQAAVEFADDMAKRSDAEFEEIPNATKERAHWINRAAVHPKFWAWTKNQLDLTDAEVHAALAVEHIADYPGTMDEAKNLLVAYHNAKVDAEIGAEQAAKAQATQAPKPSAKPGPIAQASVDGPATQDYNARCEAFAADFPWYAGKDGKANKFHIGKAVAACGYNRVNLENIQQVFMELRDRAAQSAEPPTEVPPAAPESAEVAP